MDIEVKSALYDVQQACHLINSFIGNSKFEDYRANNLLKSAVERQFITIGEALNKALKRSPALQEQVTDIRKIIDFRNLLTHSYTSTSDEVVWDIVQTNLPILQSEITVLLT